MREHVRSPGTVRFLLLPVRSLCFCSRSPGCISCLCQLLSVPASYYLVVRVIRGSCTVCDSCTVCACVRAPTDRSGKEGLLLYTVIYTNMRFSTQKATGSESYILLYGTFRQVIGEDKDIGVRRTPLSLHTTHHQKKKGRRINRFVSLEPKLCCFGT